MSEVTRTPHGPGFQFIDSYEIEEVGLKIKAKKWLDPELPFFKDHFPGEPIMPGVLLIEAAAQAAGGLWSSIHGSGAPIRYVLAEVGPFRISRAVFPGQTIEIHVSLIRDFGSLAKFDTQIFESSHMVGKGEIVLSQRVNKA